jgi:hypothetical protein
LYKILREFVSALISKVNMVTLINTITLGSRTVPYFVVTVTLVNNVTIVTLVHKFTSILTGNHVNKVIMVINVTINFLNIMLILVTKVSMFL